MIPTNSLFNSLSGPTSGNSQYLLEINNGTYRVIRPIAPAMSDMVKTVEVQHVMGRGWWGGGRNMAL